MLVPFQGLDGLYNDLVTMDVLVHDLGMEELTLRDLENMSPNQKAQALMSQVCQSAGKKQ